MNNRQKRLCRAILEFYDASGAQPYPLAQLAKKAGYHASDIYDKDSQSGDLWPFDSRARGKFAGLLSFTPGKNPTVNVTPAGLAALENLCGEEEPAAPLEAKMNWGVAETVAPETIPARTVPAEIVPTEILPVEIVPAPPGPQSHPAEVTNFVTNFKQWLEADPAGQMVLDGVKVYDFVEAALDKYLRESLKRK